MVKIIDPRSRAAALAIAAVITAISTLQTGTACAAAAQGDTVRILLGGHGYGYDDLPAPGFLVGIDTLATFDPDAYVAGGDVVKDGTAAQWDNVIAAYDGVWDFPFLPVMGNHDSTNRIEWEYRWGPSYYTMDFGSTRLIVIDCIEYPNHSLSDMQFNWLLGELAAAEADAGVETVVLAQHILFWIKAHPRYEQIYELANAWYYDYSFAGYDVSYFFEEIWPSVVQLAGVKPVAFFAGDIGWRPGPFYDVLDGVTLVACGYNPVGSTICDAVVLYTAVGDSVSFQVISPWAYPFGPLESYDVDYWESLFTETPTEPLPYDIGPQNKEVINLPPGTFEMGDHIIPYNEIYVDSTGYTVSLSPFVMTTCEVTVAEYVTFLQDRGHNDCNGYECVDLDDPECQIEFVGGEFQIKNPAMADLPVVEVTWHGSLAYCNYLSGHYGLDSVYAGEDWDHSKGGWRLPTDAEFEYAMRGGEGYTTGNDTYYRFPWQDNSPDHVHDHANYFGTGGLDVYEGLAPVGSFPPNQYGLYDLSGNAFEWVYDPFTWSSSFVSPAVDPVGSGWWGHLDIKTIRGGGFNFHWQAVRNGYRSGERGEVAHSYIGFRVVRGWSDVPASGPDAIVLARAAVLHSPHPNPFNPSTTLGWYVPVDAWTVSLRIFDVQGRLVCDLGIGAELRGEGRVSWNGRNDRGRRVASGVYYAVLVVDGAKHVRKLILVR